MSRFLRFAGTGTIFFGMLGSFAGSGCSAAREKCCSYGTRRERPVIVITKDNDANVKNEGLSWKSKLLIFLGILGLGGAAGYGFANASDETKLKILKYGYGFALVTDRAIRAMYLLDATLKCFGSDHGSRR